MPLVQWIMQNLSTPNARGGVVGGGSAIVQQTSFVIASRGGNVGGASFYEKTSSLVATGGAVAGGESYVDDVPAYFKKIRHLPGDTVYDKCNKTWIVVSFEFASSGEQKLNLSNNVKQKVLFESEISEQTTYVLGEGFRDCPIANLPVFSGRRTLKFEQEPDAQASIASYKVAALRNQPMANLPVYPGRRKVKL